MIKQISKKEADKLVGINGGTIGSEFITIARYVATKHGKEGVKKLEQRMKELGHPCEFGKIRPAHWYGEGLFTLVMLLAKEIFGWKDLFELGYNSPALSFGMGVFVKYIPLSLFTRQAPKLWRKFVNVGNLEFLVDEKEKHFILILTDYDFHPDSCLYYAGYFLKIAEFLVRSKKITVEETKCIYRGDPCHEYKIKWE